MDEIWLKDNWFKVATLLVVVGLGWYYFSTVNTQMVFERNQAITKVQAQQEQAVVTATARDQSQVMLSSCLHAANLKKSNLTFYWTNDFYKNTCQRPDLISVQERCYQNILTEVEKIKIQAEKDYDECYRRYPTN